MLNKNTTSYHYITLRGELPAKSERAELTKLARGANPANPRKTEMGSKARGVF
jgi:hypothetical protein